MSTHEMRDLSGPGQSRAIRDLLQSIFASELLSPSRRLWIYTGWISDIEVLDNTSRQFSALVPDWPATHIRLSSVVDALLSKGSEVILILRAVNHNESFVEVMGRLKGLYPKRLHIITEENFHEKGILGDDFLLTGSMNLTYNGTNLNDEHVIYRCDPASVEEWRVVMQHKWGGHIR